MFYKQVNFNLDIPVIEKTKYPIDYLLGEENQEECPSCKKKDIFLGSKCDACVKLDDLKAEIQKNLKTITNEDFIIDIKYNYGEINVITKNKDIVLNKLEKIKTIISNTIFYSQFDNIGIYFDFWNVF